MSARLLATIIFIFALAATGILFLLRESHRGNLVTSPSQTAQTNQAQGLKLNDPNNMKIASPAFEENADIPSKYTCDGENVSPPLMVSGIPAEAKALAIILDDPDAPVPGGFVHWVIFNFDPKTAEIGENSVPANAVQGQNSAGQSRYTGPCPPSGTHHYHFKLFALDSPLNLDSSAKREDVQQAMTGHILDQTELIGLYQRP